MKEDEKVAKYLNIASTIRMEQHARTDTIPVSGQVSVFTSNARILRDLLSLLRSGYDLSLI